MHRGFRIHVLENGYLGATPAGEQLIEILVGRVRSREERNPLNIVGTTERNELCSERIHRHELNDNVDLARCNVGNALCRILADELHLVRIVEEAQGQDPRHGDVHADQFALLVLKVPRSICAAGANDQLPAIEDSAEQAPPADCAAAFSGANVAAVAPIRPAAAIPVVPSFRKSLRACSCFKASSISGTLYGAESASGYRAGGSEDLTVFLRPLSNILGKYLADWTVRGCNR